MTNQVLFLFSLLVVIGTTMIIFSTNPIHFIYWLILVFLSSSIIILCLGLYFIALIIIIIYIGAITILFLFVIMMIDSIKINNPSKISHIIFVISLITILVTLNSQEILLSYSSPNKVVPLLGSWEIQTLPHIGVMGVLIYNSFLIDFAIISMVLLTGLIGIIFIVLSNNLETKKQILSSQHQRNNSWT